MEIKKNEPAIRIFGVGNSAWDIPFFSVSPFSCKLETWLRLVGLPYETVQLNSMRKAPKGKIPWIEHGDRVMGDSHLIIEYLSEHYGVGLDGELTNEQRAHSRAYGALLEEHYHQIWEGFTFVGPTSNEISADVFASAPALLRPLIRSSLRHHLRKHLHERGISRHSEDEIMAMGIADLEALAALLGDKPFMLGEQPTYLDCTAFGFLEVTIKQPVLTAVHRRLHELTSLVVYCDRMRDETFGRAPVRPDDAMVA